MITTSYTSVWRKTANIFYYWRLHCRRLRSCVNFLVVKCLKSALEMPAYLASPQSLQNLCSICHIKSFSPTLRECSTPHPSHRLTTSPVAANTPSPVLGASLPIFLAVRSSLMKPISHNNSAYWHFRLAIIWKEMNPSLHFYHTVHLRHCWF